MLLPHAQHCHSNDPCPAVDDLNQTPAHPPHHASAAAAWHSDWADAGSASAHQDAADTDGSPGPSPAAAGTVPTQAGSVGSAAWRWVTADSAQLWASCSAPAAVAAAAVADDGAVVVRAQECVL